MAKTVLCIPCGLEFPSDLSYRMHKKESHGGQIPGGSGMTNGLPEGVTEEMLPSPDFVEAVNRIENPIVTNPAEAIVQQLVAPIVGEPIALTYKYTGTCPEHPTTLVDTIMLDVERSHFAIAFCSVCKTNKYTRRVSRLDTYLTSLKTAEIKPQGVSKKGVSK